MKRKTVFIILFVFEALLVFSQSGISGKIIYAETKEPVMFANFGIYQNTKLITGVQSDVDGKYSVQVDTGVYDIEVSYLGLATQRIAGVKVENEKFTILNVEMNGDVTLSEIVVCYKAPLVEQDKITTGTIITSNQIRHMPTRNIGALRSQSAGVAIAGKGIRGSRSASTVSYVDGLKINGDENINNEEYSKIYENIFFGAKETPVSTFSIDVDAASYSNMRRFIFNGQKPPSDAVRIEEMVNYFTYDYPEPQNEKPFEINTELSDCPWNAEHKLLHIGLQGKRIESEKIPPSNLVFLIDVSGSMSASNKLPLLQKSFKMLVDQLRQKDKVAIVVYAGNSGLVLPSTYGNEREKIKDAIDKLRAGGSTAGGAGIKLAYNIARKNFINGGNNRVILATDGDFNVGISSEAALIDLIEKERESGVFLSVLGFGTGNYKDNKMQQLADKGNGNHSYIDNINEARKIFVNEFGGTMITIAKDVKIQIDFNPKEVKAYRLIGYENRLLAKEDFDDDTKDAGELGMGHTVTALYEIIPIWVRGKYVSEKGNIKYKKTGKEEKHIFSDDIAKIKLRYKNPNGVFSRLIKRHISGDMTALENTSDNFIWSAAVTEFGLLLRDSKYKSNSNYEQVIELAERAKGLDTNGYRAEFIELVNIMKMKKDKGITNK